MLSEPQAIRFSAAALAVRKAAIRAGMSRAPTLSVTRAIMKQAGVARFGVVTSGRALPEAELELAARAIAGITALGMRVRASRAWPATSPATVIRFSTRPSTSPSSTRSTDRGFILYMRRCRVSMPSRKRKAAKGLRQAPVSRSQCVRMWRM